MQKEQNLQTYRTNISEKVSELKSQRDTLDGLKLDEKEKIDALYTNYINVSAEEVSLENLIENLQEELDTLEDESVDNLIVSIFNITQEELIGDIENRKQELTELIKNNKSV